MFLSILLYYWSMMSSNLLPYYTIGYEIKSIFFTLVVTTGSHFSIISNLAIISLTTNKTNPEEKKKVRNSWSIRDFENIYITGSLINNKYNYLFIKKKKNQVTDINSCFERNRIMFMINVLLDKKRSRKKTD